MNDPTLEEIWQARQKIWNECNPSTDEALQILHRFARDEEPQESDRI